MHICKFIRTFVQNFTNMKHSYIKALKITGIVVGSLILLHGAISLVVNYLLHERIEQRLVEQVQVLYGKTIRYGKINISPLSRTVSIDDLYFNSTASDSLLADSLGFEVAVDRVRVLKVDFIDLLIHKDVVIRSIVIQHPQMSLNLSEKLFQAPPSSISASEEMISYVARLNVDNVRIEDAAVYWRMLDSHLRFEVDDIDLAVDNLDFDFATQTASYNDSTYFVSLSGIRVLTPDSLTYLSVGQLESKDAGPIVIKNFHEHTTVGYRELANRSHLPETWTAIDVPQVETSPINIIAQILSQKVTIDTLKANVKSLKVFEDLRYPNIDPYPMPQQVLMAVEVPLKVRYINASVDTLHYTLATTDIHDGSLDIVNIKARIKNFGNRNRDEFRVLGSASFIGGGRADLQVTMKMSKACDWSIKLSGKGLKGSAFNGFLRPLFGLGVNLDIDEVKAEYTGDKDKAAGDFKMLYHGLEILTYPGESAYDIINKNAKAIATLGNSLIPKSNPTLLPGSKGNLPSERPREYNVKAERDPMKKVPVYMLSPVFDGLKKTMLPGLYIQKKRKK